MNRYLLLVLLILGVIALLVFASRPDTLDKVWMWLVGFAGYVVMLVRQAAQGLESLLGTRKNTEAEAAPAPSPTPPTPAPVVSSNVPLEKRIQELEASLAKQTQLGPALGSHFLTILRYLDDGQTTLGLMFIRGKFFAYTLEDTHRDTKVAGQTRIPEGTYRLELNQVVTPLTQRYRDRYPWFTFHIEIMGVPNYSRIYIHIGNSHADTEGCILIADGVNAADPQKMITHSRMAFERFYKTVQPVLATGQELQVRIMNEDWPNRSVLPQERRLALTT